MYKLDYEIYQIKRTLDVLESEAKRIDEMTDEQRLEYKLDDRKINNLRKRSIEKVYGDIGKSMLGLLP
jgi:histone deacetylase complex regulatory component SIN3